MYHWQAKDEGAKLAEGVYADVAVKVIVKVIVKVVVEVIVDVQTADGVDQQ